MNVLQYQIHALVMLAVSFPTVFSVFSYIMSICSILVDQIVVVLSIGPGPLSKERSTSIKEKTPIIQAG